MDTPERRKYKKHKQGYTVSATYYLRKENNIGLSLVIGETLVDFEREPKYSLYIRVAFLGQNVKIRSRLRTTLSESEFDNYMQLRDVKKFVEIETEAIRYSVYEMNPDQIANFRISEWSAYYDNGNDSLQDCVRESVSNRLKKALLSTHDFSGQDKATDVITGGGLRVLKWLATANLQPAVALYEELQPIYNIPSLDETTDPVVNSMPLYTFWDWKSGKYQIEIQEIYGDKSIIILTLLEKLLVTYTGKKKPEKDF